MTLNQYIENINKRYQLGNATEHTFSGGDLQQLLEILVPDIRATNEPKRQSCGASDYILTKKDNFSRLGGIPLVLLKQKTLATKTLKELRKLETKNSLTVTKHC